MSELPTVSMTKYELSKHDFELIDEALNAEMKLSTNLHRKYKFERLIEKFRAAHTGYLEIEKEN